MVFPKKGAALFLFLLMPTIAIIGRPNTGKSTLFNTLIGQRRAIESDIPGTTRDRVFGTVRGEKIDFTLVDTGGLTTDVSGDIESNMRRQAEESIAGADMIYFCIDVREELTAEEEMIVQILRKKKPKNIPVLLIGTKAEKPNSDDILSDFYRLGLNETEIFFVSAKERMGIYHLRYATEEILLENGFSKDENQKSSDVVARICILGRPNAGKSTLMNILSGKNISIVSPQTGTTRDNIDSLVRYEKESYLMIDTAGIRKKSSMNAQQIEKYSRMRAISSLTRADVALLIIDSTEGITHQDQTIASEIKAMGVGVLIIFSKWDLVRKKIRNTIEAELQEEKEKGKEQTPEEREQRMSKTSLRTRRRFLLEAQEKLPFLNWAPVLFLSSLEKKGVQDIFVNTKKIMRERERKISTSELNVFLEQSLAAHPPAGKGTKHLKVKYATQADVNPPKFLFFANDPDVAHFSFQRYLENRLRDAYGFWGTPIQIEIRKK
jgi:GTP-binding protein